MTTARIPVQSRIALLIFAVLVVIPVWRVMEIVPRWLGGLPPAYPGQYQNRSLSAAIGLGVIGAVVVRLLTGHVSRRAQFTYWSLLTFAAVAFVEQWLTMG